MYQSDLLFYPNSGQAKEHYRFGRITVNRVNESFVIVYEPYQDALKPLIERVASPTMRPILSNLTGFLNSERRLISIRPDMSEPDALIAVTRVLPENIHITTPVETRPRNAVEFAEQKTEFVIA